MLDERYRADANSFLFHFRQHGSNLQIDENIPNTKVCTGIGRQNDH
jgi:hypothetical protein